MITDLLDEPLETIQRICKVAAKYAPDYDVKKILDDLGKIKNLHPQ